MSADGRAAPAAAGRDDPAHRAGHRPAGHPERGPHGRRAAVVPRAALGPAVVGDAGRAGRAAVLRRLAAHPRRRAAADRRGVRGRPAGDGPVGDAAADGRADPADDRGGRGQPAAAGRPRRRRRARGAAALQPRDRLRRRPRLRQRGREPRVLGRPARGAGHRQPGQRLGGRRPAAQPAGRARLGRHRPDRRRGRQRSRRRARGRARRGARPGRGVSGWTRWSACTPTGW